MKANEAPEKLYIAINELTEDGRTFVLDHRVDYPTCTEYTLADAFIEKALAYLCNKFYFNNVFYGIVSTDFNAMEEIYEDFKNYMKGE